MEIAVRSRIIRLTRALGIAFVVALVVVACAETETRSQYDRRVDFHEYRTYDWSDDSSLQLGANQGDGESFALLLEEQIADNLWDSGFRHSEGAPDVYIRYRVRVDSRGTAPVGTDLGASSSGGFDDVASESQNPEIGRSSTKSGILEVDAIDARTGRVAWRGTSKKEILTFLTESRSREELRLFIDDTMRGFPPR